MTVRGKHLKRNHVVKNGTIAEIGPFAALPPMLRNRMTTLVSQLGLLLQVTSSHAIGLTAVEGLLGTGTSI